MNLGKINMYFFLLFQLLSMKPLAQQPRLMMPIGHMKNIYSVMFSSSGQLLVTTSEDNTVKVWNVSAGKILSNFTGVHSVHNHASFSPDEKWLAISCTDDSVRIWDYSKDKVIATYKGLIDRISKSVFSNDNKSIIVTSGSLQANLWEIASGKLKATLSDPDGIRSAMFSPNGKLILTLSQHKVKLWNVVTGEIFIDIACHDNYITSTSFSTDGKYIVTTSYDSTAKIWSATTGKLIFHLKGHNKLISGATFSKDDKKIATYSPDSTVKIWDMLTGKLIVDFKGHKNEVLSVCFSPNNKVAITTSRDRTTKLWNTDSGNLIMELKGHVNYVYCASFSPDGRMIATGSNDRTTKIWNALSGKLIHDFRSYNNYVVADASFSPDGNKMATASSDSVARLWDINKGEIGMIYKGHYSSLSTAIFSKSGEKLVTASADRIANIWDVNTGKILVGLKGHKSFLYFAAFSRDDKLVVTTSQDSTAKVWDATSGKMIADLRSHNGYVWNAAFSNDSKKIVTTSQEKVAKVWDVNTGHLLFDLTGHKFGTYCSSFSNDDKLIATGSVDRTVNIWDAYDGHLLYRINVPSVEKNVIFTLDNKQIITTGKAGDNKILYWDLFSGKLVKRIVINSGPNELLSSIDLNRNRIATVSNNIVSVYNMASGKRLFSYAQAQGSDYLIFTPDGYYKATKAAAQSLYYVTEDLKIIAFNQLDIKYNRPDKVLEAVGNTDTALIKSYSKAWEKRIRKLGIDTSAFRDGYSVPEADFTNRDKIEYEQKSGLLRLNIKGLDSIYKLDRFNVWVNEAPCYGQRGIGILKRNKNGFDTTVSIQLSEGENRIETSIINVNGAESYRIPLTVNYIPVTRQKETTHFVGIGIDEFKDNNRNLKFSRKDITDLARKLREKYGENIVIDTLFNEKVTIANIKALKQKLLKTTVNDKVILAYSGHGLLSKDFDYYLSTYSVNFENPEQNGLPYDELESLLDSIPARKKLLLIDACHSGELDKDEVVRIRSMSDSLKHSGVNANESKGIDPVKNKSHLGMQNSFELMQSLFVNVSRDTGATIIAAAGGTQFALEKGDLQNGVFTYSILEAMYKYPHIKISDLKKVVGERVQQLTNGLQKPTSRSETIAVDWEVW